MQRYGKPTSQLLGLCEGFCRSKDCDRSTLERGPALGRGACCSLLPWQGAVSRGEGEVTSCTGEDRSAISVEGAKL